MSTKIDFILLIYSHIEHCTNSHAVAGFALPKAEQEEGLGSAAFFQLIPMPRGQADLTAFTSLDDLAEEMSDRTAHAVALSTLR